MSSTHSGRDGVPRQTGREPTGPETASQLRDDIDSGRTHDKVAHADPAAAPLGTDDEAAGAAPTSEQVSMARRQETRREVQDPSPADQPPEQVGMAPSGRFVWLIVGVVVVCVLIGIALTL